MARRNAECKGGWKGKTHGEERWGEKLRMEGELQGWGLEWRGGMKRKDGVEVWKGRVGRRDGAKE